jgi:hypothetical protein
MKKTILLSMLMMGITNPCQAQNIVHEFKNPSFNGNNTSSHWLTIENQEHTRKKDIQDKLEEELRQAALEEKNSFLNRFLNNLQSRIYSRLAAQLTDNLFAGGSDTGLIELEGNTIEYTKNDDEDTLTLRITQPDGSVTEITIPLAGFSF